MTREERNALLADLRAAGVQEYVADQSGLVRVVLFPAAPPPPTADERPPPSRKRTVDERLYGPLDIDKQPKGSDW